MLQLVATAAAVVSGAEAIGNAIGWRSTNPQPKFLAATYGMADCFNLPPAETVLPAQKDALKTRCNVVEDPDNSGTYLTSAAAFPPQNAARQQLGLPASLFSDQPQNFYLDAMPVTLSLPFESAQPGNEVFMITTNKGRNATSLLAIATPAAEPNELNSMTLVGHFGDGVRGTEWPVMVTIVADVILKDYFTGERINANGMTAKIADIPDMQYMNASTAPHLIQAILEPLDSENMAGETLTSTAFAPGVFPNHCRALWGDEVTHRIRVLMSGGSTLNGVSQVLPTEEVFKVVKKSGEALKFGEADVFMGLADLGNSKTTRAADGDNYFDLCLKDPNKTVVNDIGKVRIPCDKFKLYYPRGTGASPNNGTVIWNGCRDGSIDVIHSPKMRSPSPSPSPVAMPTSMQTCADVLREYKTQGCCGNPTKSFSSSGRRLSGELLEDIKHALHSTEMQQGPAHALNLAKSISEEALSFLEGPLEHLEGLPKPD